MKTVSKVKIGMAELDIIKKEGILTTLGLGSCVGISLYDKIEKVAGMAHIMLPDSTKISHNENKAKFADTAVPLLILKMEKMGARKSNMIAKLAGGAQMFSFAEKDDTMQVGKRNVIASRKALKKEGIRIVAEDVEKNYGRTIELSAETGKLLVKSIGKEITEL